MKENAHRIERFFSEKFNIPPEGIAAVPVVTLHGTQEAEISECESIRRYDGGEIVLKLRDERLQIVGTGLCMESFAGGKIRIRGKIFSLCWKDREEPES